LDAVHERVESAVLLHGREHGGKKLALRHAEYARIPCRGIGAIVHRPKQRAQQVVGLQGQTFRGEYRGERMQCLAVLSCAFEQFGCLHAHFKVPYRGCQHSHGRHTTLRLHRLCGQRII